MRVRRRTLTSGIALVATLTLVIGVAPAVAAPGHAARSTATVEATPEDDARPGEVVSLRTRSSSTVRNANGTLSTTLSAGAVHFRDGSGAWKRIDGTLVAADEPGYAYRNKANGFAALFKGALADDYLRFTTEHRDFTLSLVGGGSSAGKASGHRMSYPDAVGKVGLDYDLLSDGIKETLVLPDASSATAYHFRLTPSGTDATRVERRPDGSWAFYSGTRLAPVFTLDAPVALDAAGNRQAATPTGHNAALAVKKTGASYLLDLTLDAAWLHAPERRFPVALDPTITIAPPVEDASFAANCAACGPYVSDKIYVGTDANYAWRGAVQFDLGDIPAGADVTSASMQAYWAPLCMTAGTGFCNNSAHQIDAHAMTGAWSTSTASGSLRYDPAPFASATVSAANPTATWVSWPITTTLRNWLAAAKPNFGVLLKRATEPLNASGPVFYGRRYAEPALQPKLVVTYPGDGVNLLVPDTLHANGADLRWTPYPATATAPFTAYEVHRSANASFTPSASTLLTSISDPAITSFRDTTAAAGQAFTYKVVTGAVASSGRTVTLPATGKATKTLQQPATDGDQTTVAYFPSVTNCAGYGAEPTLYVGPASDSTSRALVHFDVRDIPADATITSAVASLWHYNQPATAQTVRAYPATAEWREGTAHSACLADSATWYDAYGDVTWANLGGDMESGAAATVTHAGGAPPGFDAFDVTALTARWVAGATPNNGLVIRQDQETPGTGSVIDYYSDDFGVAPSLRPKLVVTYTDGSTPAGPTVSLAEPQGGTTVSGSAVPLSAAATDDRRVDTVEFLIDGTLVATDTTAPWTATWNSTTAPNAGHTVTVRATDDAGNVTTSTGVGITVANSAPPTTSLTAPTGGGVSAYADAVTVDRPIAWWRLGEATGPTVADSSGNNRSGTAVGAPTTAVNGALGRDPDSAIQMNASSDDYVAVPPAGDWQLNGSFTIEWWGSSVGAQTSQWPGFFLSGASWTVGTGWLIFFDPTQNYLAFKRDNKSFGSLYNDVRPAFRHFAVVYDEPGTTLRWYVDGGMVREYPNVTFADDTTTHGLRLGHGDQWFASSVRIDEPAIYDTALSASRIAAHYSAGSASATTVSGTVPVAANAADDGGVARVDFLADGVQFASDTTAPYTASWDTLDAAHPAYDGVHVLTTRAYDADGQLTESSPVPVRVDNTSGTAYQATTGTTDTPDLVVDDPTKTSAVDVTVTNDSAGTWTGASTAVQYSWVSSDATPVVTAATPVSIGADLAPGATRTVHLDVAPPTLPDGVGQAAYTLKVDVKDTATGTSFAAKGNKPVENGVQVAKSLEDTLGLERWHQYSGTELGAGLGDLVDIANGNNLWNWTPSNSPGRGISTVVGLTYNSLEKSGPSPVGPGVSLSISSLSRLGAPIDIHPNKADQIGGNANRYVTLTDGDGTTHRFDGRTAADGTVYWDAPPGVHLYLRATGSSDPNRTWAFSRPDRVTFYYDTDGYPTSVEDANGNRITYTLERIPPGEDGGPVKKRITAVTDAGGRAYRLDYYSKAEVKKQQVRGLLQRLTDHDGSAFDFTYYDDGNLRTVTQRGGVKADGSALPDRTVVFTYTTSNGDAPAIPDPTLRVNPDPKTPNQSALVYSIRDPRGAETRFTYYGPGSSQLRGRVNTVTDRSGATTTFSYDLAARTTTVAAPMSRTTVYTLDTTGRATTIRNPLNQDTTLTWNGENQVTKLTEPTGAYLTYDYNDNGYQTRITDQNAHTTQLDYQNVAADANDVAGKWETGRTIPHYSQLQYKTNPRGTATATVGDYRYAFAYDAKGNLTSTTDPTGATTTLGINPDGTVSTQTDPRSNVTRYDSYDANGAPTLVTDALGNHTRFGYDADGNLRWTQDARHDKSYPGIDPRDYRTYLDYDAFGRMGRQSAPKSTEVALGQLIWSGADFDPDDNVILEVDPHYGAQYMPGSAFQTTTAYDAMDRPTMRTAKRALDDTWDERTSVTYDAAGRAVKQILPLGMKSGVANDHATDTSYDLLDRVVRTTLYEVDAAGALKRTLWSHRCYDLAGDLVRTVSPRANLSTVSCTDDTLPFLTKYTYDAGHRKVSTTDPAGRVTRSAYDEDGNVTSSTDEGGQVKTTAYDQRDMPVRTTQPYTGGTTPRVITTLIEYDPAGNRSRIITPRAYDTSADKATFTDYVTRYVYDAVNQLVRTDLPTTAGAATSDQHYRYQAYDPVGNVVTTTQEVAETSLAAVPQDKREDRSYFDPSGWIRISKDHVNPPMHFDMDAAGRQTSRIPEKKGSSDLDLSKQQVWRYAVDGMLAERGDGGGQKVTYGYDADNVMRTMVDSSGVTADSQKTITVQVSPDGLDRPAKTRQKKSDQSRWTATASTYDQNGNVTRRVEGIEEDDGGTQLKAGRQSDFTFDGTDRLTQQVDQGKDGQASTSDDRRISTTYFPQGWEQQRDTDKYVPGAGTPWQAKQTQTWTYYDNGQLRTMTTKNASGSVLESHDVSYLDAAGRYVDGNQTTDTYRRESPVSTTPCATSTCTAQYTYDARDRLTQHDSGGGGSTRYTFYPSGDVKDETETSVVTGAGAGTTTTSSTTSYAYKGDQLDTVTSGNTMLKHQYDDRGDLDCVTGAGGTQGDCNTGAGVQVDYSFDYLDRMTGYENKTSGDSTSYTYDALDRLTRQEDHGSNARTTDFDFVGLTDSVSKEQQKSSDGSVTHTKTYSYDAYGSLNAMTDQPTDGPEKSYSYGKDPLGSISMLVDDSGHAAAAYGYRPYGDQDDALTVGDELPTSSDKQVINPVRFTEKRYDSSSGTLQMGSRRFGPDSNHFLQEDHYDSALADLGLSTDPLTSNRYSLAGGNPANFVEYDGHFSIPSLLGDAKDAVKSVGKAVGRAYKTKVKPAVEKRKSKPLGDSEAVGKAVAEYGTDVAGAATGATGGVSKVVSGASKDLRSGGRAAASRGGKTLSALGRHPSFRKAADWSNSTEGKITSRFTTGAGAVLSFAQHKDEGDSTLEAGGKALMETAAGEAGAYGAAVACGALTAGTLALACGAAAPVVAGWASQTLVKWGEENWGDIKNAAGDAYHTAEDTVNEAGDTLDDAADDVGDTVDDAAGLVGL